MKKAVIALGLVCCYCCAMADGLSDRYMDIMCDWFSAHRRSDLLADKLRLLADEAKDDYDKSSIDDLAHLYGDPVFKANDAVCLSYFVPGPIWHVWPNGDSIKASIDRNKAIMDLDLACEIAYSARDNDVANGLFSHTESDDILMQKSNVIMQRMELRRKWLNERSNSGNADYEAIDYMKSNMAPIRRIFRSAERESAMVAELSPSCRMRQFVWVVNLLGGNAKELATKDLMIRWREFYEIEDWLWINEGKIDSEMIDKAQKLYAKLCLPLYKFDSNVYERMLSNTLYKEIARQAEEAGIVPISECRF